MSKHDCSLVPSNIAPTKPREFTMEDANYVIYKVHTSVIEELAKFGVSLETKQSDQLWDKLSYIHNFATDYKHQMG